MCSQSRRKRTELSRNAGSSGLEERWLAGLEERWLAGLEERWLAGLEERWLAGLEERWLAGLAGSDYKTHDPEPARPAAPAQGRWRSRREPSYPGTARRLVVTGLGRDAPAS